jgi:hypothetical protein
MDTDKPASLGPASLGEAGDRQASVRYIDRPEIAEIFADAVNGLLFDGQTLRIELGVTRFDDIKPNAPITGRRYPAVRLALSPAGAVDLINRMQQIAAALTQAGIVKPTVKPPESRN